MWSRLLPILQRSWSVIAGGSVMAALAGGYALVFPNWDGWPIREPVVLQFRFLPIGTAESKPVLGDYSFRSGDKFRIEFRSTRAGYLQVYVWDRAQRRLASLCDMEPCPWRQANEIAEVPTNSSFETDDIPGPESLYAVFGPDARSISPIPGAEPEQARHVLERSEACDAGAAESSRERVWMEARTRCKSLFVRIVIQHKGSLNAPDPVERLLDDLTPSNRH